MEQNAIVFNCNIWGIDIRSIVKEVVEKNMFMNEFSTGTAIRRESQLSSDLWWKMKKVLDRNILVSEDLLDELLIKKLSEFGNSNVVFLNYLISAERLKSIKEKTKLSQPLYWLYVDEKTVKKKIIYEWESSNFKILKKYYPNMKELEVYIKSRINLKRNSETYASQSGVFDKIDVSSMSKVEISKLVLDKIRINLNLSL